MKTAALTILLTLAACSSSGTASTPAGIDLSGSVTRLSGAPCSAIATTDDVYLGGRQLTIRDGGGRVIGTTTTDAGTLVKRPEGGCMIEAHYAARLPRVAFYVVQVSGVAIATEPVSLGDLAAKGFVFDIEVSAP